MEALNPAGQPSVPSRDGTADRAATRVAGARACPRPAALSCDPRSRAAQRPGSRGPLSRRIDPSMTTSSGSIRTHACWPALQVDGFGELPACAVDAANLRVIARAAPLTSRPTPEAVRVCPDRRACCRAVGSAGLVTVRSVSRPAPRDWSPARVRLLHQRRPGPRPSQGSPYVASGSGRSGRSPVTPPASPATGAWSSTVMVI
jgi:hypothetical protein